MTRTAVTVVGSGPHGLLCALELARRNLDVTVLGGPPAPTGSSPRMLFVHWSMLPGLERLGLLEELLVRGLRFDRWSINAPASSDRLAFDLDVLAGDTPHPYSLHVSYQDLAQVTVQQLATLGHVTFVDDCRVSAVTQDADGCTVTALTPSGEQQYRSDWVVGADGLHSAVRRSTGLGLPGMTWPERFVMVNVRYDLESLGHSGSGLQLDPVDGALVARATEDGLWRYTYAEDLFLPEESVADRTREVLDRVLGTGHGAVVETVVAHRMHQRVADRFRAGRVLLIGDAAHMTTPTAGYALPAGFFDSVLLAEALAEVAHHGADPEVLDQYSESRRRVFTDLVSPVSSDHKQMLWNSSPARVRSDMERFRHLTASRDRQRSYLLVGRGLQSAPLRVRRRAGR